MCPVATPGKDAMLAMSHRYVCPNRVEVLSGLGTDLVIGRREGYRLWDLDGAELIDVHLNGGVYNLGHRNPELVSVLRDALDTLDIGNHHLPSVERALLAERLAELTPGDLTYSVFGSGGGEAIDLAVKTARRATGRRRVVSATGGYHGHTGLALAAGDERAASSFLCDGPPGEFVHVPFGDVDAMAAALAGDDVAAVLLETIPATLGFPPPPPGYLPAVAELARAHGSLYVADEVQTGLGRTGPLWAVEGYGVVPDILVTGKGLSGGLYPITATVLSDRVAGWLREDGWSHISTFGGAELGARVARAVLDITTRPEVRDHAAVLRDRVAAGLAAVQTAHPATLTEVRQSGLVCGLRFAHPQGGLHAMAGLYRRGVWAVFAGFDPSVLQLKPGLLLDVDTLDLVLDRIEATVASLPAAP